MKRRHASLALGLILSLVCLSGARAEPGFRYWVFFRDKGPAHLSKGALERVRRELGERTLLRRSKVLPPDKLVDAADLPVWEPYVKSLEELGAKIVVTSRWLNAVSVIAADSVLSQIRLLPFVRGVQPVARRSRRTPYEEGPALPRPSPQGRFRYDYGSSYNQVGMLRVPELHNWGITGAGIIIGMLDAGYDWRNHEALQSASVLGEWDFIWNDDVTADEPGQDYPGQASHGTMTFAVIAGFMPGKLIGAAFGARFYLAKTERVYDLEGHDFEQPVEEDYWVAGLEWLERNGVDIVSTSLAYLDWYTPADMDGNTAVVTVAADMAVKKGVFVVASAGNEGDSPWQIVTAPADGDSVLAVGAVRPDGLIATFSSHGPTADGRIKPDVVAQGVGVYTVSPGTGSSYTYARGTSFSCPLVAGVAALVLSAHPELEPMELRDALRETASRAAAPDTIYGWGIVDAVRAALYHGPIFSNLPSIRGGADSVLWVSTYAVSKDGFVPGSLKLRYRVDGGPEQTVEMAPTDTAHQYAASIGPFPQGTDLRLRFTVVDSAAGEVTFPRFYTQWFRYQVGAKGVTPPWEEVPEEFRLYPSFPNPFRKSTRISFDIPDESAVRLEIYDVRGRLVKTLVEDRVLPPGRYGFDWRGLDENYRPVATGVYLVRLRVAGKVHRTKVLYLH